MPTHSWSDPTRPVVTASLTKALRDKQEQQAARSCERHVSHDGLQQLIQQRIESLNEDVVARSERQRENLTRFAQARLDNL